MRLKIKFLVLCVVSILLILFFGQKEHTATELEPYQPIVVSSEEKYSFDIVRKAEVHTYEVEKTYSQLTVGVHLFAYRDKTQLVCILPLPIKYYYLIIKEVILRSIPLSSIGAIVCLDNNDGITQTSKIIDDCRRVMIVLTVENTVEDVNNLTGYGQQSEWGEYQSFVIQVEIALTVKGNIYYIDYFNNGTSGFRQDEVDDISMDMFTHIPYIVHNRLDDFDYLE